MLHFVQDVIETHLFKSKYYHILIKLRKNYTSITHNPQAVYVYRLWLFDVENIVSYGILAMLWQIAWEGQNAITPISKTWNPETAASKMEA